MMTSCREDEGRFVRAGSAGAKERRATVGGLGAWPQETLRPHLHTECVGAVSVTLQTSHRRISSPAPQC
jgi:hypothetical protein